MKNKVQIDLDYLVFAWQDDAPQSAYYLDVDTGSVILVQQDLDELDDLKDEIELQPGRYLYVPKPDEEQLELDLADFIYTISDQHLKSLFEVAYEVRDKIGSCKVLLNKHPEELRRWQKWRADASRERAKKWLLANDLECQ